MKTKSKSAILITGANKGLGREAARRLVAAGHEVWAAARDRERGRAPKKWAHIPWFSTSPTTNPCERQQRRSPM